MGFDHGNCTHPRTPAGRAACRRERAGDIHGPGDTEMVTMRPSDAPGKPRAGLPPTHARKRGRSAGSVALKRPNTRLRTIGDLTDVPPALASVVRKSWDIDGWEARVGEPYNDAERRIVVTTPRGELALVWRAVGSSRPGMAAFWRPVDSSITRRIDTINGALRLANGEEE